MITVPNTPAPRRLERERLDVAEGGGEGGHPAPACTSGAEHATGPFRLPSPCLPAKPPLEDESGGASVPLLVLLVPDDQMSGINPVLAA